MSKTAWSPETLRELRAIDLDWQRQLQESARELDKTRAEYEDRLSTEREKIAAIAIFAGLLSALITAVAVVVAGG